MAIGKYKLLFQTNSLSRAWTIFGSKLLHFVHERKKKREKKNSSPLRFLTVYVFHRPPIIHLSYETLKRFLSSFFFFFFTRSPLFRDIGLTLAPASTTSKPEAEDPPRHPAATPVIRSSIAHPSPSTIVIS